MAGSDHKVEIVVGVRDLASSSLRNIQKTVSTLGTGFSSANSFLGAFHSNLGNVISKMDTLANSMYKFNMYTSSLQRNLRNITLLGAAAAGGVAVQGANNALQYDYIMKQTQARMGVNSNVRKDVSNYILNNLANRTAYSPIDIANMSTVLGQAGINNAPDMKSLLKSTSYFSEAVDAVPADAAEMVISAAKGFGISMKNSQQITDKLTVALNQSLLHVEELPHAIGELAGRANMYGQNINSSLSALMVMRDQGISADQGSQDFIHALAQASRIGNDTTLFKKTRGYFNSLGITNAIFDPKTRQLKEFPELIGDMEKAMIKKGFINPKYKGQVNNESTFNAFLAKNGGAAPKDFWDSEKAMPLISRIFGTAGMIPVMAGLQAQYDQIDPKTGKKTGKVYYGANALRQEYNMVQNADGATKATHDIISNSGQYQLERLKSNWQGFEIRMMDNLVPLIQTGATQLGNLLTPGEKGSMDVFRKALKSTVNNYKSQGHNTMAGVVDFLGNGAINTAEISQVVPSIFKQIGSAINKDLAKANWGNNLITFPMHIVENGIKFVSDIVKANKDFNDAVNKLPKNLQNPAKLVDVLVKGGVALMVTGVVVKTVELGIRGVSLALKGTKLATSLTTTILSMLTGKTTSGGNAVSKILGSNMAIKANIVNVYGGVVNGGKGGVTAAEGTVAAEGEATIASTASKFGSKILPYSLAVMREALPIAIIGDLMSGANGGPSFTEPLLKSKYNPLNNQSDKKIDEMYHMMKDPSKYSGPRNTELKADSNFFKPKFVKSKQGAANYSYSSGEEPYWWKAIGSAIQKFINSGDGGKKVEQQNKEFMDNYSKAVSDFPKNTYVLQGAIVDGFNSANNKLQNLKLNNAINVVVQPPQVNVTGNIANSVKVTSQGSSSFTQRENSNDTAWSRMNSIMQRRLGWR